MRRKLVPALAALAALTSGDALACRVVEISFTPAPNLQIVVWLEDPSGQFVDTLFITKTTGSYGLGNRPGIMQFNSEYLWPYGRRESVFPIWAHRHGKTYPKIVFQDEYDVDLSHSFTASSPEPHFCRPLLTCDMLPPAPCVPEDTLTRSIDMGSCATQAFTDKGKFQRAGSTGPDAGVSLYPPRADLGEGLVGTDSHDVSNYRFLNDLDAVSRATPAGSAPFSISWPAPGNLPPGQYRLWIEVAKERDQNGTYHFPSPSLPAYWEYGTAYRGQPSVVWSIPFDLTDSPVIAQTLGYGGYGDPDGIDGRLRAPDGTITSTIEGSGAERLLQATSADGPYRVRLETHPSDDNEPPTVPRSLAVDTIDSGKVTFSFVEPADMPSGITVSGYDVRISPGVPMEPATFRHVGAPAQVILHPSAPGTTQQVSISGLQPSTQYWLGVSAYDGCLNLSTPAIVTFVTPPAPNGEVSTCFVATAAFGSGMKEEVSLLRRFRDGVLRRMVVGELLVETYYTFGPAMAGVIRPSDTLRAEARAILAPVIDLLR